MPVNVLYIHQDGNVTGSAISLRNLLLGLDREQFSPRVLLAKDGPARDLYEKIKVPVDVVPIYGFWTAPGSPWYRGDYYRNFLAFLPNRNLANYLKRLNPDIIHINDKAMLSAGITAFRLGFPIIWHLRSTYQMSASKFQAMLSKWVIQKKASFLIAISEDEVDGFQNVNNLKIIYNSVDLKEANQAVMKRDTTRKEFTVIGDEIIIGMIGQLTTLKGAWDFITMAGAVQVALPDMKMRFVLVAPIPEKNISHQGITERLTGVFSSPVHPLDEAYDLASRVGIKNNFVVTGYRSDVLQIIAAFDIAVSCYRLKAIGRPALEAMSVGRPVVVTSGHSGRSEVVRNRETGIVVPSGDLQALANAVIELACNPCLRKKMGENGILYSEANFSLASTAKSVEHIYEQMIGIKNG